MELVILLELDFDSILLRLNSAKKFSGMTISDLSSSSGIPIGTLNKLLSGQTKDPQISTIAAIAQTLSVSLDWIIYGNNRPILSKQIPTITLSELMKEYRRTHGLSQRQLATKSGLTSGYISILERNFNPQTQKSPTPSLPALSKLAAGMDMSLNELFERTQDISNSPPPGTLHPAGCDSLDATNYSRLSEQHKQLINYMIDILFESQS